MPFKFKHLLKLTKNFLSLENWLGKKSLCFPKEPPESNVALMCLWNNISCKNSSFCVLFWFFSFLILPVVQSWLYICTKWNSICNLGYMWSIQLCFPKRECLCILNYCYTILLPWWFTIKNFNVHLCFAFTSKGLHLLAVPDCHKSFSCPADWRSYSFASFSSHELQSVQPFI